MNFFCDECVPMEERMDHGRKSWNALDRRCDLTVVDWKVSVSLLRSSVPKVTSLLHAGGAAASHNVARRGLSTRLDRATRNTNRGRNRR
jgi:uncharacterized protein YqjF (DUF2071 family)